MGNLLDYGKPEGGADLTPMRPDTDPRGLSGDDFRGVLAEQQAAKDAEADYWEDIAEQNDFGKVNYFGKSIVNESLTANLFGRMEDWAAEFDPTFDPEPFIDKEWPEWRQDAVREAKNQNHALLLTERTEEQDLYNKEGQYHGGMGTAINLMGAVANPENFVLGLGEVAALTKLGLTGGARIAAGAGIGALSNTAQEAVIISNNKSRDRLGLLTAATFGGAFGAVGGLINPRAIDLDKQANEALGKGFSNMWKRDFDLATGDIQPNRQLFRSPDAQMWDNAVESGSAGIDVDGGYVVQMGNTAARYDTKAQAAAAMRLRDKNIQVTPEAIKTQVDLDYDELTKKLEKDIPKRKGGFWSSLGLAGRSSDNPHERALFSMITEDASGTGGKNVASHSAALKSDMYAMQMRSLWHPARHKYSKQWMKETGSTQWKPWDTSAIDKFDDAVVEEIQFRRLPQTRLKGVDVPKSVRDAADHFQALNELRLKRMKESGVEGYDVMDLDNLYMKHKWDGIAMTRMKEAHGEQFVIDMLARSIMRGGEFGKTKYKKLGDKLTDQFKERTSRNMAHAIYNRFTVRPDTHNLARASHITMKDRRELTARLERVLTDAADRKHVLSALEGKDDKVVNDLMSQIDLDLNFSMKDVTVRDLIDTNLGASIDTEIRRSAGKAAMADIGFKSRDDFMETAQMANRWNRENITGANMKTLERKSDQNFKLWNMMMGENLEKDASGKTAGFFRGMRKWTTLTALNQVGFAQFAEFGRLTGAIGVKGMIKQIPQFNRMIRDMKKGTFKDPILNDIEAAFGIRLGDNEILSHPMLMVESGGLGIAAKTAKGYMQGLDTAMNKGLHAQGWINGMNAVMKMQHRMHARGFFMNMFEDLQKANLPRRRLKRYAELGWTPEDLATFKKQMGDNVEMGEGWFGQQRPVNFNIAKMSPGAREKLVMGFWRDQANTIQRNLGGETAWWMESTLGKLLSQFRSFPLVAIEKQTLRDIKMRDGQSLVTGLAGLGFAALAYTAKTHANSFSLPAKKRKQYLKNRLSADKIFAGAASWSGQAAILPDILATAGDFGVDSPFAYTHQKGMDYRNYYKGEGLDPGSFAPGFSIADNAYRFATGIGQTALSGEDFRKTTFKYPVRSIPFGNSLFLKSASNYFLSE